MIIRKLEVAHWKCFANPFVLGEFSEGLNIIHGPNSSGKSSLMSALVRGFFDTHRTASNEIEQLRPWGRALAPQVTIEYESADGTYRIVKQWLDHCRAELSRREANAFVRVAEDDQAVDQLRKLFSASTSFRGASAPNHWGIAQVLWSPQRAIALGETSGDVLSQVERALSGQGASESALRLTKAMDDLFGRYFTPQGRIKSGKAAPPYVLLDRDYKELIAQRDRLRQALDERQRLAEEIASLENELRRQETAYSECERRLNELRPLERKYAESVARVRQSEDELATVIRQQTELADRCRKLDETRTLREKGRDDLRRLEADAAAAAAEARRANEVFQQSEQQVRAIEAERPQWQQLEAMASAARRWSAIGAELRSIEKTLTDTASLDEQIAASAAALPGISREQIEAMRAAASQRRQALRDLEAASIRVVIEPEAPLTVESRHAVFPEEDNDAGLEPGAPGREDRDHRVEAAPPIETRRPLRDAGEAEKEEAVSSAPDSHGEPTAVPLRQGRRYTICGETSVELRLPGVARLRAVGPQMSLDEIRQQLEQAERQWTALVAETGVASLDEAQRRFDDQSRRETERAILRAQREQLLAGQTPEQLRAKAETLRAARDALFVEFPQWRQSPPDAESLARELADTRGRFDQRLAEAAADREEKRSAWTAAQRRCDRLEEQCRSLREKCGDWDKAERELAGDETDEQRRQRSTVLSVQASDARFRLQRAKEELYALNGDPAEEVKALDRECASRRAEVQRLAEALNLKRGRMSQLEEQAAYDEWSQVNEKLAAVEPQIARERRRMDSIRLLKGIFEKSREEMAAQWHQPIRLRAVELLERLIGDRFATVTCSDEFRPTEVLPREHSESVAVDAVAGSEWELIHFAVRLALAEALGRQCRLPMIFDDALTYTDDERMQRIAALLDESAARFQILVFTCHPDRYRALSSARWFDLPKLAAQQRRG